MHRIIVPSLTINSYPTTGAGKQLQPTHRLRLGFGQKLSVRHVSNPLDSTGSAFADLRSTLKVRSEGRLR